MMRNQLGAYLRLPISRRAFIDAEFGASECRPLRVPTYPRRYAPILQGDRKSANIRAVRNSSENDKVRQAP